MFHVIILQQWQRNVQKSVMYMYADLLSCQSMYTYCFLAVVVAIAVVAVKAPY